MTQNPSDDVAIAKATLRKIATNQRGRLSSVERAEKSVQACKYFLEHADFRHAEKIALYWPIGDELDCRWLIEKLNSVALPCIVGSSQPLVFREFEGENKLVSAPFGTHEPAPDALEITPDIVVLPLLAFDKSGARLGYGGGFYDRTLDAMSNRPILVGVAFDTQEQDFVPTASHDRALDMIVTETGVTKFTKRKQKV